MGKEYYSISDLKAMILCGGERYYFIDQDVNGNYIEIEIDVISSSKKFWVVNVLRFYTSIQKRITSLSDNNTFQIESEDFHKIRRKSKFL